MALEGWLGDLDLNIKASFGVATLDSLKVDPTKAAEQLLLVADERLYTAKERGRNQVVSGM